MRRLAPVLLLLALAAPAAAQEDCSQQADPCPWIVQVDVGVLDSSVVDFTQDDWYELNVTNLDGNAHTVTLSGYGVSLTVPGDEDRSMKLQFTNLGDFQLKDETTGKTVTIHVVEGDSVDYSNGTTTKAPAPGFLLLGLALAAAGIALRRRIH